MKILLFLLIFFTFNVNAKYYEYTLPELPDAVDTIYLRDSLRYLTLTSSEESIIHETLRGTSKTSYKLLTFQNENIRVLIIYDNLKNEQTINIISLENAKDLYHATSQHLTKTKFFQFRVNKFYADKYHKIREEILRNIKRGIVKINTVGTTSVYGTLLAIEVSSMQLPVESLLIFGGTVFTTQEMHQKLANLFGKRMLIITHENDISHKMKMPYDQGKILPNQRIICENKNCSNEIFELRAFNFNYMLNHFLNFPPEQTQIYHDSILKYYAR